MAFDPTLSCPIIRNFECIQGNCSFWSSTTSECGFYAALKQKQDYNELTGTRYDANNVVLDLGQIYKDITIMVTAESQIRFSYGNLITLNAAFGRVGVPVIWRDINARYVSLKAVSYPMDYLVAGDG